MGLIGLADDLGVRLNNGRPGAREGPRAFRAALARYGVAGPIGWEWPTVFDAGDITPAEFIGPATLANADAVAALHETHRRVTEAVGAMLEAGLFPIAVGGGHDLTFPFVRAAAKRFGVTGGVYFDAHTDVRETPGSGMAFRRLIEDCGIKSLHLHGSDPFANSVEHIRWLRSHGGRDVERRESTGAAYTPPAGDLFASFDLDVLDASHAPGVSAMNPAGWSPHELAAFASTLAREARVRCMDIMELNPIHDEGGRTARLAARLFLTMLRGFAERGA